MPISVTTQTLTAPEFKGVAETLLWGVRSASETTIRVVQAIKRRPIDNFLRNPPAAWSLTATGASIVASTAIASRATFVPKLLEITQRSVEVGAVLGAFPLVGRILELGIGQAGLIGAMLPAASFLAVTSALLVCRGPAASTTSWVVAHIALGAALAPLLMPGVVASPAILALTLGCVGVVSGALTSRLLCGQTTWPRTLAAVGATLLFSPMGAELATGKSVAHVLGSAGMIASLGAVAMGIYFCVQAIEGLTDTRSPLVKQWEVPPLESKRLDLKGDPGGTIYGLSSKFENHLWGLRKYRDEGAPIGLRRFYFHGPAGSGKALTARGLAKFLGIKLIAPRPDAILRDKNPAEFVKRIFDQTRVQARRHQAPLALYFGDFDTLVEDKVPKNGVSSLFATFQQEMSLDVNTDKQNLIVILGASNLHHFSSSIWTESFGTLCEEDEKKVIYDQIQEVLITSPLKYLVPFEPSDKAKVQWAKRAERCTGARSHTLIESAVTEAITHLDRMSEKAKDVVCRCLDAAFEGAAA